MKNFLLASTALVGVAMLATPAKAVLMISADVNGTTITCADGQACDTFIGTPGKLGIADQTVNGVEIVGSAQTQVVGSTNSLNTSSFQIVNHNLGATATVVVAVSGINFVGPTTSFAASGSGTWQNAGGSTINLSWWGDPANTQGANNPLDLPGSLLTSFSNVAVGAADSFATGQVTGAFVAAGPYSMSLGTTGVLAAWDGGDGTEPTLVGRSQALVTTAEVPEPGSLALFGTMLLVGGLTIRRKQKKDADRELLNSNFLAA